MRVQKGRVWAVSPSDDVFYYQGTCVSADPLKEIELNRLTTEVLARLPQFRIIDKVTVIRGCQHMAFVAHPGGQTYLERLWNHILALADLVERAGQLPLATELRSLVERWRTP